MLYIYILAIWCEKLTHLKRPWCWERLKAGGEGDDRGWDGWMASPTQWTWVWVNCRSWWWTGRPGVLRSMGSQRVGHNWVTELNWSTSTNCRRKTAPVMWAFRNIFEPDGLACDKNCLSPLSSLLQGQKEKGNGLSSVESILWLSQAHSGLFPGPGEVACSHQNMKREAQIMNEILYRHIPVSAPDA